MYFVDYEYYKDYGRNKVMVFDLDMDHKKLSLYWVGSKQEIWDVPIQFDGDTEYVEFYDENLRLCRLYASSIY